MKIWLAFLAAALSLGAADFTGNWIGTVQIPSGVFQVTLTLHQKGEEVSGAIATPSESYPIQKVKLSGNNLSFEVTADDVYVIDCVQEEDRMTGDIKPSGGGAGKISVTRSK
jgi:hypothetical protein